MDLHCNASATGNRFSATVEDTSRDSLVLLAPTQTQYAGDKSNGEEIRSFLSPEPTDQLLEPPPSRRR